MAGFLTASDLGRLNTLADRLRDEARFDDAECVQAASLEIQRLRSLAGAVSSGHDAAEVLKPLRHKAPDADDIREMLRNASGG